MARVVALYRYPVKSFTPQRCDSLTVRADGRVAGDRVLGFRFADTAAADDAWSPKAGMLALMHTPGVARLRLAFDDRARRLRIELDGELLVDESIDGAGREHIAAAVQEFALGLDESPLRGHAQHLPLRLVGDGVTPRFHDRPAGELTLHGRASLGELARALGESEVDEVRFRSNVAVDGLGPWEELAWESRAVRIGEVLFDVVSNKLRCLATQANPGSGDRDRPVLTTLTRAFAQEQPTFAVSLRARAGGTIALGDEVEAVS